MVRNARVLERSSWRWSHVAKWTLAIAIAALASSAMAGLDVTVPVTVTDENLILAGDYYDSIIVDDEDDDVYGMAAFVVEDTSADIIIMSPLLTNIVVTADGGDHAAAMYVDSGAVYTNSIVGTLSATAVDQAFGVDANTVVTGAISGSVQAVASEGDATGLWGRNGVHVASITEDGTIMVSAAGGSAFGIASNGAVSISGAMDGVIQVISDVDSAGMIGSEVSIGSIGGTIMASTTDGDGAYGVFADFGPLSIGDIDGNIIVSASGNNAFGLEAFGDVTVGDVNGVISAHAGVDGAGGIDSLLGNISIGDIDGTVSAVADSNTAYGIHAGFGNVVIGNLNGVINADADGGPDAYGILAMGDVTTGDVNGVITATASGSNAAGIMSDDGDVTISRITEDGHIAATAADHAYGIYASGNVTIGEAMEAGTLFVDGDVVSGAIDGTVTAHALGDVAYGIYSDAGYVHIESIGTSGVVSATADGNDAAAIFAADGEVLIGNIAGTVSAHADVNDAYGIRADDGTLVIGNVSGTIQAVAGGSRAYAITNTTAGESVTIGDVTGDGLISAQAADTAYGINSTVGEGGGNVTIGNIDGYVDEDDNVHLAEISAQTTVGDHAIGIRAGGDVDIESVGVYGRITADSAHDEAYGIWAGDDVFIGDVCDVCDVCDLSPKVFSLEIEVSTGGMDGIISATAEHDYAYGIYAGGNVEIGSIGEDGVISAQAGMWDDEEEEYVGGTAYGIYAVGIVQIGDIDGDGSITAEATSNAYGIYSADSYVDLGNIYGTVRAETWYGNNAYAIYASTDVDILDIYGSVTADSGSDDAYGIYSGSYVDIGYIDGDISADADYDTAYGIYAVTDVDIDGIDGEINATAWDNTAYAIYAGNDITIGDIGGDVYAEVYDGDAAYGIYADDDIETGTISGTVEAYALDDAYGIHAEDNLTTTITGSVIAQTSDGENAIAISAYGPMDILVDGGTVSGRELYYDDIDEEYIETPEYAIRSGHFEGEDWVSDEVDDRVEIVAGSTIVGIIDLGDEDEDGDTLILRGTTGTTWLNEDIVDVETIDVNGGTWHINGNVDGDVSMIAGQLMGDGTFLGNVDIQEGILAPGNSIGTLTIMGDLTLGEDTEFIPEISNDPDIHDLVEVGGVFAANGGTISPTASHFITDEMTVTVIHAEGGLAGDGFGTFTFTPYFDYDLDTEEAEVGTNVVLDVTPADFTEFAVTKNQRAVGNALNSIRGEGDDMDPDMQDAMVQIRELQHESDADGGNGQPALLDELLPQDALGLGQVSGAMMMGFNDNLFDRVSNVVTGRSLAMDAFGQKYLAAASNTLAAPAPKEETWAPFVRAIGSWGNMDGEKGLAGYKYNIYGLTAGADKMVNDNWLVGVGFGGATASVDYDRSRTDADIDAAFASLYASYIKDNWHVDATLSYGHTWIDSQRGIDIGSLHSTAKNKRQGDMYSLALQSGINLGDKTNIIEPIVGVGFTSMNEKGYKEKGAGVLNLDVDSDTTNSYYSKLGIRLATEMNADSSVRLVPEVGAFWIHDFSDRTEVSSKFATGSAFKTEGLDPAGDSFDLAAGISAYFTSDWRLFAIYDWKTSSDLSASTVRAGVQWKF